MGTTKGTPLGFIGECDVFPLELGCIYTSLVLHSCTKTWSMEPVGVVLLGCFELNNRGERVNSVNWSASSLWCELSLHGSQEAK